MVSDDALMQAAAELRAKGPQADIPHCRELYTEARAAWVENRFDAQREKQWRQASLIYGGMLGLQGNWRYVVQVFADRFDQLPVSRDCLVSGGMMSVGQAVALWNMGQENAGWAAMSALGRLGVDKAPAYNRWRGVAAFIQAATRIQPPRDCATWAVELLDPQLQPTTYGAAQYFSTKPGCYRTQLELLTDHQAVIPPTEGLYLFNEER